MKHRYFLLAILLLLCVFLLIPESSARITYTLVNGATQTTSTDDTDDVSFTIRITGEAGDSGILTFSIAETDKNVLEKLSINPSSVTVNGSGTWDVKFTISRTLLSTPGKHAFNILVLIFTPFPLPASQTFTVNVEQADDVGDTLETATLLTLGTPYRRKMDYSGDVDYYRIVVTEPGELTVWATGKLDTEGELLDSADKFIEEGYDDGPRSNFKIVYSVKSGTYYLKVTEFDELTGNYVVRSTFVAIPDAGDTRATARTLDLDLDTPLSDAIHISDVSDDDVDYYRIVVTGPGELTLWTTSRLEMEGELQNSSGGYLTFDNHDGPGDNFRIVHSVEAGTYYLKVTERWSEPGRYAVHAAFEPGELAVDVGDTRQTATLLTLGTPFTEDIDPLDDVDYYRIVVTQSGKLTVWATGEIDTVGQLQADDGTVLGSDDDSGADELNFKIVYIVEKGTYYIKVNTYGSLFDHGSYTVHTAFEPGKLSVDVGNTRQTATLLTLGTPFTEDIDPLDDVDYYRIVVTQSGKLTVWTTGEIDTVGELQANDGTVLGSDDDSESADWLNFKIAYIVEAGTYYIKVSASLKERDLWEDLKSYAVHAALEPGKLVLDAGNTRDTATLLTLGTPFTEDIEPLDDVDYYRIVVTQSGELTAWTTGDLDTVGELQNSAGWSLADSDDIFLTENFKIVHSVEAGTYYLKVIGFVDDTKSYTVQAAFESGEYVRKVGDTRQTATLLDLGTPFSEDIEPLDDVDYYRIVVTQSGELTAWTTGDLDTVGELQNSAGWYLVENDNDGTDDNFRIVHFVEAGTYYLRVEGDGNNIGNYVVQASLKPGQAVDFLIDTGPTGETRQTPPDLSTHRVVLSEFMFESEGGENSLPQWIEVYNNSSSEINFRGWKLQWKRLQPSLLEVTTTFKQDFIIPAQQSRVIVTALGRHSMGSNLSNDAVYQLHVLHAEELAQDDIANRNRLITRRGFSLKLINSNDVVVDQIGTLSEDTWTWQLPICLIEGARSSLIRRFDKGVPRSGLERRGWRRAYDTKRLVAGLYYGHQHDLGTPGYRRGKPLPVELSQFSARFDKARVVIRWTTASELNNAGFNILRSDSRDGEFAQVNEDMIQGNGTTGQRSTYQWVDITAKPHAAYYYRIEDVSFAGERQTLATTKLKGLISAKGKLTTTWGILKSSQ